MKGLTFAVLTSIALLGATGAQADTLDVAGRGAMPALVELGGPEVEGATTGCADSGFCTLTELLGGGSISAGGLTFGGFSLDGASGYDQWDTDNIMVQVFDFGGALMLDYNFAPSGFGDLSQLSTLLADFGTGLVDLSYQVTGDGSVDVVAAWLYDMGGAGTGTADYELQTDMLVESGGSELAYLYYWLDIVNNGVVDFDINDFAGFAGVDDLTVTNSLSHISYEGLNLLYYVDQVFLTETRPVPEPVTIGLFGLGLLALATRQRKAVR